MAGIGLAMFMTMVMMVYYYVILVAYVIYYLFASMTSELPWASCGNEWNTPSCAVRKSQRGNQQESSNLPEVQDS